jgi:protein-S-isoprenylcysteine O-methyltransferase Ste14
LVVAHGAGGWLVDPGFDAYGRGMDPHVGRVALLAGIVLMLLLRAPHARRAVRVPVVRYAGGLRDVVLVTLVGIGLFALPLLWISTPLLQAFDYPLHPGMLGAGILAHLVGFRLLVRSHVDLGENWSNTIQLRENQVLVSSGVYRRVRHPMYAALLLFGVGQALVAPNWVAGPAFLVTFVVMVGLRLGPEERMMVEAFGDDYEAYRSRTDRLVPGVF